MEQCIFCKIIKGDIPAKVVYKDERVVAIEDINPQAPYHLLIIPKSHIPTLNDLTDEDKELVGYIYRIASKIAQEKGFGKKGYRIVANCNPDGGQTVYHIHFHLLGGRFMRWPPG